MKVRVFHITLLNIFLLFVTDALGDVHGPNGTLTVSYLSSGPGQPDGYENASVDVKLALLNCAGELHIAVERVRGSVKASDRYWFEGKQVPASAPPPNAPSVEFTGTVFHQARELGRFGFVGAWAASDSAGLNCFGGNTRPVGKFKDWGDQAAPEKREQFIRDLTIRYNASPKQLTNPAIHEAIRSARAKAKQEAEAAERERRAKERQAEEQRKAQEHKEAEAQERSKREAATGAGNQAYASGDFWGAGTAAQSPSGTAGKAVRSADGRYYSQGSDGQHREISAGEYQAMRNREAQERQKLADEETQRRNDAIVQRAQADQKRQQVQRQKLDQEFDRKMAVLSGSYYIAEAARNARGNMEAASRLQGSYASAEELEADYARRMRSIEQESANLAVAQRSATNAAVEYNFGGGTAAEQSLGALTGMLGAMMQNAEREKQEERARALLREEREQKLKEIAARQHAAMLEMRKGFLAGFPDGGVPLSSHKVPADELYFFAYTFDPRTIEAPKPKVVLTNTFAIARRGDGTWPFKHVINGEIQTLTGGQNTLMGYYESKEMADDMRNAFVRLATKNGFVLQKIEYAGRPRGGAAARSGAAVGTKAQPDFWGSPDGGGKKAKPGGSDDFWR